MHYNLVIVLVLLIIGVLAMASAVGWYHLARYRVRQYRGRLAHQAEGSAEGHERTPSPALTHASLTNNYRVRFVVKENPESTVASNPSISVANATTGVSTKSVEPPPPAASPPKPGSQAGKLHKKSPGPPVAFEVDRPTDKELRPAALKWTKKDSPAKSPPAKSPPAKASSPTKPASPTKSASPKKASSPIKASSPVKAASPVKTSSSDKPEHPAASPTKSKGSAAGSSSIGLGSGLQFLGGGNYGDMH